jgi:2-polyprenyl-6-methoxyphenol hydroxylase-like FAD-dependent oxidoreductase
VNSVAGERCSPAFSLLTSNQLPTTNHEMTDVLIVGAGPTGLALAVWLARFGVRFRIIDRNDDVAPISRALGVHARTLEFYRQLGFANEAVESGVIVPSVNLWARGHRVARVPFGDIGRGLTPFPFVLDFAQDEHERLLIERLTAAGCGVERKTVLTSFTQDGDAVCATLRHADGSEEECRCAYLAGCDGTHSTVRAAVGAEFGGGTYDHLFYVADVIARGPAVDDGIHVDLDEADLLAVFDMKGSGHVRLVGTIPDIGDGGKSLTFADVGRRPLDHLRLAVEQVQWFSTYRVHHRVANRFRVGRAFLLGDAAHVHSPVGAQGMNTGIGDATNLAWKLAAAVRDELRPGLLDTYEAERIGFARRLVATTDRAFEIASKRGALAGYIRTRAFPLIVSVAFRWRATRRYLFRTVSQIMINYRGSALSTGRAGAVHGGDRLPWLEPAAPGDPDNYESLKSCSWQVHVYGDLPAGLTAECARLDLELHGFPWRDAMASAGLARGAMYLVRPDGYVALANAECDVGALRDYWGAQLPSGRSR